MGIVFRAFCVGGVPHRPERSATTSGSDWTPRTSMNCSLAAQAASRLIFRIALPMVLAVLGPGSLLVGAQSAKTYYKQGQAAEAHEDFDAAFNSYQKAYSLAPKDLNYKQA